MSCGRPGCPRYGRPGDLSPEAPNQPYETPAPRTPALRAPAPRTHPPRTPAPGAGPCAGRPIARSPRRVPPSPWPPPNSPPSPGTRRALARSSPCWSGSSTRPPRARSTSTTPGGSPPSRSTGSPNSSTNSAGFDEGRGRVEVRLPEVPLALLGVTLVPTPGRGPNRVCPRACADPRPPTAGRGRRPGARAGRSPPPRYVWPDDGSAGRGRSVRRVRS